MSRFSLRLFLLLPLSMPWWNVVQFSLRAAVLQCLYRDKNIKSFTFLCRQLLVRLHQHKSSWHVAVLNKSNCRLSKSWRLSIDSITTSNHLIFTTARGLIKAKSKHRSMAMEMFVYIRTIHVVIVGWVDSYVVMRMPRMKISNDWDLENRYNQRNGRDVLSLRSLSTYSSGTSATTTHMKQLFKLEVDLAGKTGLITKRLTMQIAPENRYRESNLYQAADCLINEEFICLLAPNKLLLAAQIKQQKRQTHLGCTRKNQ